MGQEHDAQAQTQRQRGMRHEIAIAHRSILCCVDMAII
jgi:hypothetical protein